jgi:hypothetical protein
MARRAERPEDLPHEFGERAHERLEHPAVGVRVGAEAARRVVHRALEQHRGAVVQGVRQRYAGMHQLEPMVRQRQAAEEGRGERQGVHRGAGVVHEAR